MINIPCDVKTTFNLANMFLDGHGGPKDEAMARTLFAKADAASDVLATSNLANMLRRGQGGPKDEAMAYEDSEDYLRGRVRCRQNWFRLKMKA